MVLSSLSEGLIIAYLVRIKSSEDNVYLIGAFFAVDVTQEYPWLAPIKGTFIINDVFYNHIVMGNFGVVPRFTHNCQRPLSTNIHNGALVPNM